MAEAWLSKLGFTQICFLRGTVSWTGVGDGTGKIRLCYHERGNDYCIHASKTAGDERPRVVCELLIFLLIFDKIKTLSTKTSKFHFVK